MLERASAIDGDTILPLEVAKAHLRITHSREDAAIRAWRDTALDYVERQHGKSLIPTAWIWTGDCFPSELPIGPVTEITKVEYRDQTGELVEHSGARLVRGLVAPAHLATWPTVHGEVRIEFTAGLEAPALAPKQLSAAKVLMAHLEKNRGDLDGIPAGVRRLVSTPVRI